MRERSERAEARRELALSQLKATARGHTTNGLPHRRAAEELSKQVLYHTSSMPEQYASLIWLICNSLMVIKMADQHASVATRRVIKEQTLSSLEEQ